MVLSNDFLSDPRVEKEARALMDAGWTVTVVAWGRTGEAPASEDLDGISVRRVGPPAAYGSGLSNVSGFRSFWKEAEDVVVASAPDVVHCHDLDTAMVGLAVKKRLAGVRFVLDLHEIYPESNMMPQRAGLKGPARALARTLENRALGAADLVLLANPGFEDVYAPLVGEDKLVVAENAPDLERFRVVAGSPDPDTFRVCYIGQKRYPDALRVLMEAVQSDPRLHALLAGGGSAEDEVARMAEVFDRVEVSGRYDYDQIGELYEGCDAVYVAYDASLGNLKYNFPVKAIEGMACGLPVLAGTGTWAGEFVESSGTGYAVDGRDAESVARALVRLADEPETAREMGLRGREIAESQYNWASASARLVAAYDAMMGRPRD
jgi:glycosyltransferase involved in cell wall biosynthesis